MSFNSYIFILLFMPLVLVGYFLVGKIGRKAANLFLILASLAFYAYGGYQYLVLLVASCFMNYLLTTFLKQKKSKALLAVTVALNLAILGYFKYLGFFITNINQFAGTEISFEKVALPLGISFITFQQIAYAVQCYREEMSSYNFMDYILFILYFPKIAMGPLAEPKDLIPQFHDKERLRVNTDNLARGMQMFATGLFKKMILADNLAKANTWVFSNVDLATSGDVWILMFTNIIQLYFDFSGYTDMATGIACMMNIELPMNFDSPMKSYSLRDFWKRWHLSLTGFFTKYVYIPLGGSRKGAVRTALNTLIVFILSGFWHGADWNYLLWGLLDGVIMIIGRAVAGPYSKMHKALQWILAQLEIGILVLLFSSKDVAQWLALLQKAFTFIDMTPSLDLLNTAVLTETSLFYQITGLAGIAVYVRGFAFLILFVSSLIICLGLENNYRRKFRNNVFTMFITAFLLIWCIVSLGQESVFIYSNF